MKVLIHPGEVELSHLDLKILFLENTEILIQVDS